MKDVKFTDKMGIPPFRERLGDSEIVLVYTDRKTWERVKHGSTLGRVSFYVSFATLGIVLFQALSMFH